MLHCLCKVFLAFVVNSKGNWLDKVVITRINSLIISKSFTKKLELRPLHTAFCDFVRFFTLSVFRKYFTPASLIIFTELLLKNRQIDDLPCFEMVVECSLYLTEEIELAYVQISFAICQNRCRYFSLCLNSLSINSISILYKNKSCQLQ